MRPASSTQGGLKSQGEKEWPQRVSLLHPCFGCQGFTLKEKLGVMAVAPLCPRGHGGKAQPHLPQNSCPINGVESVDEVQLEENLVGIVAVRMDPVPGCTNLQG